MLSKMQLMQKLERKIKENEDLHVTLEPMIELVKAEKNKLMIQRLEIESELRKLMGKDPNSDIAAAKASGDEDMEASVSITSSIVTEQFSSSFNESVELDETNAVMSPAFTSSPKNHKDGRGYCEVDLSLDSRLKHRGQEMKKNEEEEEEEEEDDDDDVETDVSESEEELNQDGVYVDEEKNESGIWQQLDELLTGRKGTPEERSPSPKDLVIDED